MRKKKEKFMQIIIAKKNSDVPETLFPSCVCDEADTNRRIQYFMRWNVTAAQSLSVFIWILVQARPVTLRLSFAYNLSFIERGTYWEVVRLLMASLMQTSQMRVYTFFMLYLRAAALLTKIRKDRDHLGISRVEIHFSRSLLKII